MNLIVPHMRVNTWINFWSRKKKFLLVFYSHFLKASLSFIHPLAPKHFTHFYFCACTFTITLPLISLSNFPPLLSFLLTWRISLLCTVSVVCITRWLENAKQNLMSFPFYTIIYLFDNMTTHPMIVKSLYFSHLSFILFF